MPTSLTRHATETGPRWACDGVYLPVEFTLGELLALSAQAIPAFLDRLPRGSTVEHPLLAPPTIATLPFNCRSIVSPERAA